MEIMVIIQRILGIGNRDIVFNVACHWDSNHGHRTITDLEEWIKTNLGDIKIKEEMVSY